MFVCWRGETESFLWLQNIIKDFRLPFAQVPVFVLGPGVAPNLLYHWASD